MAIPSYTYLKLKMSGPNGVITVGPTYRHAYECDVQCVEYAEALAESMLQWYGAKGGFHDVYVVEITNAYKK